MISADCEYETVLITMSRVEAEALLYANPDTIRKLRAAIRHAIDERDHPPVINPETPESGGS